MPPLAYRREQALWDADGRPFIRLCGGFGELITPEAVRNVKRGIREFSACQRVGQKAQKNGGG